MDMIVEITGELRIPFGRYKGFRLMDIRDRDYGYVQWLARTGWVLEKYPEVAAYVNALDVVTRCPGMLDGLPCVKTVLPCGYCWAHAESLGTAELFTCAAVVKSTGLPCSNATVGVYCGIHKRNIVETRSV